MDVVCVGGGPAGLYFAICARKLPGDHTIRVIERDPPGATSGWGVTYPDRMLDMMFTRDPQSAREIRARSVTWYEQEWRLGGESAYVPHARSSLERAALLEVLGRRAAELGVDVQYGREVADPAEFADADLVVAADGVGSVVRRRSGDAFGTTTDRGRNRFIWLGTDHVFPRITFAFERTPAGWMWMHAYPSSTTSSTCVVECSPETWQGLQLDTLPSDEGLRVLEAVFSDVLAGGRLLGQPRAEPSRWQRFQHLTNRTWCSGNVVLAGDAAHAAHFTLASGTRHALTDAVTLADSLRSLPDLSEALHRYDGHRRERAGRAVASGRRRAEQWEHLDAVLDRDVHRFVQAMNGHADADPRRPRPLYRATQAAPVRLARRQALAVRRWNHARHTWTGGGDDRAVPAPGRARSAGA
jgi:anthraniloyl-CoA monooxygenase